MVFSANVRKVSLGFHLFSNLGRLISSYYLYSRTYSGLIVLGRLIFSSRLGYMNIAKVDLEIPVPISSLAVTTPCGVALKYPPECI